MLVPHISLVASVSNVVIMCIYLFGDPEASGPLVGRTSVHQKLPSVCLKTRLMLVTWNFN